MTVIINYLLANWVEVVAAVFSIASRIMLGKQWLWTPLIMFCGSALWAIFGLVYGHWLVFALNGTLALMSAFNQYQWLKKGQL